MTAKEKKKEKENDKVEAMRLKATDVEEKAVEEETETKEMDEEMSDEKVKKEDDEEDEDNVEKDSLGGTNPEEGVYDDSTTTNPVINRRQHVLVPNSNVQGSRVASGGVAQMGQSPSNVTYSGKSVNPDLTKSPLFVELNKSIEGMQSSVQKKLEAIEKSVNDRIANLQKTISKMEKFYESPFYKSIESDNEHTTQKSFDTMSDRLSKGNVQYTD